MCRHGEVVEIVVNYKTIEVDKCLVPYIKALNTNGIKTCLSCCGHGEIEGSIMTTFEDKYRLIVIGPIENGTPKRFKEEFQKSHEKFENERLSQGGN